MGGVLDLFLKEGDAYRVLKVPLDVVEDLLADRLCAPDVERIRRLASATKTPSPFKAGSVVVDFASKSATCLDARLDTIGATWRVKKPEMTLGHY